MTEEPIMIDDVDVSGCYYLEKRQNTYKCEMYYNENCNCSIRTDCYYKQLKRKEQECKKLLEFNNSLVEEHKTIGNDLYKEIKEYRKKLQAKEQECEELKNKYSMQLHKNIEKQCRINELQNIVATKEFILKVNGKKYTNLSGIDKAKLFINNENRERNKKILELENEISAVQWKFYDKCKKVVEAQQQLDLLKGKMTAQEIDQNTYIKQLEKTLNRIRKERDEYKQSLQEIKKIAQTLKTDICSYCDSKDTDRCNQTDTDELQQIINKCEVLNDKSIL